jgi:SAM-dependent methyltransferase
MPLRRGAGDTTFVTTRIPERLRWTIELLGVTPAEHLLEIGCGPGHAISLVCNQLGRGTITAIDRSAIQVARARERNRICIAAGRARVEQTSLADAALGRRFDKIFAINVNAFWTAPAPSIAGVRRHLGHHGAVYLVYEPPTAGRLREVRDSLSGLLTKHGFQVEDVRVQSFREGHGLCITGRPREQSDVP